MKEFIKKNLWSIILVSIGVVCIFLSNFFLPLILIGLLIFGIVFIHYGNVFRKRYKKDVEYNSQDDYFDASKLFYDEDVYYIGPEKNMRKEIKKNIFSKINSFSPAFIMYSLGVCCIFIPIVIVIKVII